MSRARPPPIRKCRPTKAASFRSRLIWRRGYGRFWRTAIRWRALPAQVREWLEIQQWRSLLPAAGDLLVETFPRAAKYYLVCYPFEGRLAHQTLGMLLTRRLERARMKPLGFVANEYALAVWGLGDLALRIARGDLSLTQLFDQDMLGDDLEAWLAESALMKRTFRSCAIIAGLIERRFPGEEKSRRQLTISTDLVYDVLRKHQADHLLLPRRAPMPRPASWTSSGSAKCSRASGRIVHKALDHVSPLAVPVMLRSGADDLWRGGRFAAGGGRGSFGRGGDAVSDLSFRAPRSGEHGIQGPSISGPRAHAGGRKLRHDRRHIIADPTALCTGPSTACSRSPICIWKKARASPRAGSCCRLTIRRRRWRASPA